MCQQPSKKPRPSSKRGHTASGCNSIYATTDPTPAISVLRPLRTGHNRLNHHHHHLIAKFRSELCPCQTGSSMATEHLLPACPLHDNLRNRSWPLATPEAARQPELSLSFHLSGRQEEEKACRDPNSAYFSPLLSFQSES